MPYFVKLPYTDPAFPVKCPFCNKEAANRRVKVEKKEYKPLFDFKSEMDSHEVMLPMCGGCKTKGHFFAFLSFASVVLFFAIFIASFFYAPLKELSVQDMVTIFGITMLITISFSVLRYIHVTRFKIKYLTKDHFTVQTSNEDYAKLLASRNQTFPVKKLFLFKPLQ